MASAKGARTGAMWGTQMLQDGEKRVLGEMDTGYQTAQGFLDGAGESFKPYADRYNTGSALYADALGLGGAAGTERARQAYTDGPGYQFAMERGLEGINRRRAAGGMLGSGNADIDAIKFTTGMAQQGWNGWLDRLSGMDRSGATMAGAQAGLAGQRAGLAADYYNRRAGTIDQNLGQIVGLGVGALKAGDQAKTQNQANMLALGNAGLSLLGSGLGSGGFFTKLMG